MVSKPASVDMPAESSVPKGRQGSETDEKVKQFLDLVEQERSGAEKPTIIIKQKDPRKHFFRCKFKSQE